MSPDIKNTNLSNMCTRISCQAKTALLEVDIFQSVQLFAWQQDLKMRSEFCDVSAHDESVIYAKMMKSSIKSSSKNCQLSFYEDNDNDAGSSRAVCAWQRDWDRL